MSMSGREELKERIENLEKIVEEQSNEIRRLKGEDDQGREKTIEKGTEGEEVSRRDFLKKLGIGAAGLGLLSLSPAAAKTTISPSGIDINGKNSGIDINGRNLFTSSGGNGLVINDVVTSTDDLPGSAPEGAQIVVNPPESQPELYIFEG